MREHEIELISALVEGRLEDESEVRALIASSPEMQTEYESQKIAHEALASAGTTHMREDERAELHRDLWTALRAEPRPSRAPWYYRWVPITAGLLIIFVVGIMITDGQSETATFEAADAGGATSPTSTVSARGLVQEEPTGTTMAAAAAATTTAGGEELDNTEFAAVAESLREDSVSPALEEPTEESADGEQGCLERAGLESYTVVRTVDPAFVAKATGSDITDVAPQLLIAAIPEGSDLKTAPITFVDADTCQVVQVED